MTIAIRQATPNDADVVSGIILEAALWLEQQGMRLWDADEIEVTATRADVEAGLFFIGYCDNEPGGTIRYEHMDTFFWPDIAQGNSAFVHRIAVLRQFSGGALFKALLDWAVAQARSDGKRFLRLDCDVDRIKLRQLYENYGFTHHSDKQAGPYHVARYEIEF